MPKDAPVNTDAPPESAVRPFGRVLEMQTKLHRWAAADPGRRFDDLFNLVHDPATLIVAWQRVAGNTGARSPGVDGRVVADVEDAGVQEFLDDLRAQVKEPRNPDRLLHGGDGPAVNAGRVMAGVARDPGERHPQRRRVMHEIEQVVEPAARIGHRPTVKLGLHT